MFKLMKRGVCLALAGAFLWSGCALLPEQAEAKEKVMSLHSSHVPGSRERAIKEEDRGAVSFSLWGGDYVLEPDTEGKGGQVCLSKADGTLLYEFPLDSMGPWFRAESLRLENGKEFLFVEKGMSSVSDGGTTGRWLLGSEDGEIVDYLEGKSLRRAGLLGYSSRLLEEQPGNEIWIQGTARDRDCTQWEDGKIVGYSYKGHEVTPQNSFFWAINAVSLDWDEEKEDFILTCHDDPQP